MSGANLFNPLHILVVDDSEEDRGYSVNILRDNGHVADEARDGGEALTKVSAMPYDLILMDLEMPGMDGFLAAQEIRSLPFSRGKIPIIALTFTQNPEDVRKAFQFGMNNFILKPLTNSKLVAATMVYNIKRREAL